MKAVILAGGRGTRLGQLSSIKPKPMVEIGNRPIIWHIMKLYSHYGVKEFIICAGYLGYQIKDYFINYSNNVSDVKINLNKNSIEYINKKERLNWEISIIDTGQETMTGGRLLKIKEFLDDNTPFFMTYGDGLADINLSKLLDFHKKSKKLVTMTAVYPPPRFGSLVIENNLVTKFSEKNIGDVGRINGGFFVCEKQALKYINNKNQPWESLPLVNLSSSRELSAFLHNGFWQPMDTLRERDELEKLWKTNSAPWKVWV
ncbi:MAG: glucose-1-phosphate cytidylyltransferase [Candidatus Pelagibacter sp.]|nr:glucose-1-phosphate cytidylyltransferase [Candidatus Pelagibacter sp.]OUV97523.1 MAG: glucose-1-phosphate cytidylyltransferase [Candidatus Pelagibacter sp. TMED142]